MPARFQYGWDPYYGTHIWTIYWAFSIEKKADFAAYADDLCILIDGNSRRKLEIEANIARTIYN